MLSFEEPNGLSRVAGAKLAFEISGDHGGVICHGFDGFDALVGRGQRIVLFQWIPGGYDPPQAIQPQPSNGGTSYNQVAFMGRIKRAAH